MTCVIINCINVCRHFVNKPVEKNVIYGLYNNMWLSSLSIFGGNQFYEIKRRNI